MNEHLTIITAEQILGFLCYKMCLIIVLTVHIFYSVWLRPKRLQALLFLMGWGALMHISDMHACMHACLYNCVDVFKSVNVLWIHL